MRHDAQAMSDEAGTNSSGVDLIGISGGAGCGPGGKTAARQGCMTPCCR